MAAKIPAVALLAHGSMGGNGWSNSSLSFACSAETYLTIEQVNDMIQNGIKAQFPSSSMKNLVGVEDDLLKDQFPSQATKLGGGPAIINTGLFLGKDISKRIPLYVFRDGPNDAQGKPPKIRSYVSVGDLLTSQNQQKICIPANSKLIILCCRAPDGIAFPQNIEITGKALYKF